MKKIVIDFLREHDLLEELERAELLRVIVTRTIELQEKFRLDREEERRPILRCPQKV